MTVKELQRQLDQFDYSAEVYISVDEEGNRFKTIDKVYEANGQEDDQLGKIKGAIIYPNG